MAWDWIKNMYLTYMHFVHKSIQFRSTYFSNSKLNYNWIGFAYTLHIYHDNCIRIFANQQFRVATSRFEWIVFRFQELISIKNTLIYYLVRVMPSKMARFLLHYYLWRLSFNDSLFLCHKDNGERYWDNIHVVNLISRNDECYQSTNPIKKSYVEVLCIWFVEISSAVE